MKMDFRAAGLEVTKAVLKLYKVGRFRRENAILGDELVRTGTNAGAYIDMVEKYGDLSGRSMSTDQAVRELDKLAYIAYVMQSLGLFSEQDVAPVLTLAQECKAQLMKELRQIIAASGTPRAEVHKESAIADAMPNIVVEEKGIQLEITDINALIDD